MYKNVLESIGGIELYPIISMLLFITVFVVMIVWAMRKDKVYLDEMSSMPLKEDHPSHTVV